MNNKILTAILLIAGIPSAKAAQQAADDNAQTTPGDGSGSNFYAFLGWLIVLAIVLVIVFVRKRARQKRLEAINRFPGQNPFADPDGVNGNMPPRNHMGAGDFIAGAATGYVVGSILDDLADSNQVGANDNGFYDNSNDQQNTGSDDSFSTPGNDNTSYDDSSSSSDDSSSDFNDDSNW